MVIGSGVSFVWQLAALDGPSGLHPMLAGVLSSSLAMVLVSLATQKSHPLPREILDRMAEASGIAHVTLPGNQRREP
jgi:hypothetical protein